MVIDCNDIETSMDVIFGMNYRISMFSTGAPVYGTITNDTDNEIGVIVSNETEFSDQNTDANDNRIHMFTIDMGDGHFTVVRVVRESDFIDMINEHKPFALEAIFLNNPEYYRTDDNEKEIITYASFLKLDKAKLREAFERESDNKLKSATSNGGDNNKVKMAFLDMFTSIRLLMFAWDIAEYGYISDYKRSSELFKDLMADYDNGISWSVCKKKYKPVWSEWHTKLAKKCPKAKDKKK